MINDDPLNVLFICAEAEPFIKIGGLGDVAGSLPKALLKLQKTDPNYNKLDLRVVIPFHSVIREKGFRLTQIGSFSFASESLQHVYSVFFTDEFEAPTYLLSSDVIDGDGSVYHADPVLDGFKFVSFSIACLELSRFLDWPVNILHANDWHTAAAIYALKTRYKADPFFSATKSLITLHNLPYMGWGAQKALREFGLPPSRSKWLPAWARHTPLPLGILKADKVVAVSPNYAKEIMTPDFGFDLVPFLDHFKAKITGIVNGIDTDTWDPSNDRLIEYSFDADHLEGKQENKLSLLKKMNLNPDPSIPLITLVSRMDEQKGIDLALQGLKKLVNKDWQAIILGTGNPSIEKMALELAAQYPHNVRVINKFDAGLAHSLYAGADMFLMPSRYEPCGLSQMIAMRYGTLPVATKTGGLADTIIDVKEGKDTATGFLFAEASLSSFTAALLSALKMFQDKPKWLSMLKNGMRQDFSWQKSANAYGELYNFLQK